MRVVYLSPTFAPYRVAVFDRLQAALGRDFVVFAAARPRTSLGQSALRLGAFNRKLLNTQIIPLTKKHNDGTQTPASVVFCWRLPLELYRHRPDAVISNNLGLWTAVSLIMGYRVVVFWEGTAHTERTVGRLRAAVRRWIVRHAAAFVVNGALATEYLASLGAARAAIYAGGMCAAPVPDQWAKTGARAAAAGPIRFLFVGRLIPLKGLEHLLAAAALLAKRTSRAFLVDIVGAGPQEASLKAMAARLGLTETVQFHGGIEYDRVWEFYRDCHVFVLPTLQDNWPLVVPEAMAMAMPVLLSRYAGNAADLVSPGRNGWVFEPTDHEAIATHMRHFLDDPTSVTNFGEQSRRIVACYTPETAAAAFARALEWCVAKPVATEEERS